MPTNDINYFLFFVIYFNERKIPMKRIDKDGIKRKLNITYIHNKNGKSIGEILKERYLNYISCLIKNKSYKIHIKLLM